MYVYVCVCVCGRADRQDRIGQEQGFLKLLYQPSLLALPSPSLVAQRHISSSALHRVCARARTRDKEFPSNSLTHSPTPRLVSLHRSHRTPALPYRPTLPYPTLSALQTPSPTLPTYLTYFISLRARTQASRSATRASIARISALASSATSRCCCSVSSSTARTNPGMVVFPGVGPT